MDRCSPEDMRKNLLVVEAFMKQGVDFVAVPVKGVTHKEALVKLSMQIFDELASEAEHD